MNWYLIHTKPKQEFRAKENLENQSYEVFLPTIKVQKIVKKEIKIQEEPLFTRYIFINLDQISSNWFPIKSTRGVHEIVRFGMHSKPVPVPTVLIEALKNHKQVAEDSRALFQPGDPVEVLEGPFKALQGDFIRLFSDTSGQSRALVLIQILGKAQKLIIPAYQLKVI
jgi:transcriptional antiterminator RfaH